MPIYEYRCLDCGALSEILVVASGDKPRCNGCGSGKLEKMISAHSSMSGLTASKFPGPGDTACCGSSPTYAGCAGPGSCCGKQVE